jgi:small GTP-binding protein
MLKCKVVILGPAFCGKTSIARAICLEERADNLTGQTVGHTELAYTWTSPTTSCAWQISFWDTAGSERFQSLMPTYLRGADLCYLVFSLADSLSFAALDGWLQIIREQLPDVPICLVGNKSDLVSDREIQRSRADDWKATNGIMEYVETSAVSFEGLSALVETGMSFVERGQQRGAVRDATALSEGKQRTCC